MLVMSNVESNQNGNAINPGQANEAPKVFRVEDYSQRPRPMSTRAAVAADNSVAARNPTTSAQDHSASIAAGKARAQEVVETMKAQLSADPQQSPIPNSILQASVPPASVQQPAVQQPVQSTVQQPQKPQVLGDLSQLVNVGKIVREVVVSNYKFTMHTLTSEEHSEALASVSYIIDQIAKLDAIRTAVLARAIDLVNGVPLENLYQGSEEGLTKNQKKEKVVGSWQQVFTQAIFDEYDKMVQESIDVTKNEENLKN